MDLAELEKLALSLLAGHLQGINLAAIAGLGLKELAALVRSHLSDVWDRKAAGIAKKLTAEGWTYASTTHDRPTAPAAYVADIQYRLWAAVLRGGLVKDALRDHYAPLVLEIVRPSLTAETTPEAAVRLVIAAQLAVLPGAGA